MTPIISRLAIPATYLQKPWVIAIVIAAVAAVIAGLVLTIRYTRVTGIALRLFGVFLLVCGAALAYGKFRVPAAEVPSTWVWVPAMGVALLVTAWFLRKQRIRAVRDRISGLAAATAEHIDALIQEKEIDFLDLTTTDGRSVLPLLKSLVSRSKNGWCIVLTGSPGSGKTATLLNFAADCQQSGSARRRPVIAMYIDLAEYAARATEGLLAEFIQSKFPDLSANKAWKENGRDVRWVFLFDNADQADLRWNSKEHSWKLVTSFVRQRSRLAPFYAVVAARTEPESVGPDQAIELDGLTNDAWEKLLTGAGVNQTAIGELATDTSFHWYLSDPGTLKLLAPVLARRAWKTGDDASRALTTNDNVHEMIGDAVNHLLQALPQSLAANPQSLRATAIAIIRFLQTGQGFAPDVPGEITKGLAHIAEDAGSSPREIENNLNALARCGIVKRIPSLDNTEYLEFGPAIGAYFYTCALIESPDTIPVRELLCNWRLRLTAISLLKIADNETVGRFVQDAERLLDWAIAGLPTESTPSNTAHERAQLAEMAYFPYVALSILVEGLQHRLEVLDKRLREKTIEFTEQAMPFESSRTQADLLKLSYALGTREQAISTMKFGLDSPDTTVVFDTASRMVNAISESEVAELDDAHRSKLVSMTIMVGLRSLAPNQNRSNIPSALRLADGAGAAATILYGIVFGIGGLSQLINFRHYAFHHSSSYPFPQICEILAFVLLACPLVGARYNPRWRRFFLDRDYQSAMIAVSGFLAIVGAFWAVIAVIGDLATFTMPLMPLLISYSLLWPVCVLSYLASNPHPTITNVIFPFSGAVYIFRNME